MPAALVLSVVAGTVAYAWAASGFGVLLLIVGLWLLGFSVWLLTRLQLGDRALPHGPGPGQRSRSMLRVMAVALLLVSSVWSGLWGRHLQLERASPPAAGSSRPSAAASPTPSAPSRLGQTISPGGLRVGECFNAPELHSESDSSIAAVEVVSCAGRHDGEAYFVNDEWDAAHSFPGDDRVESDSDARCEHEFESYVQLPYADSALEYHYWYPSSSTWADGDRKIVCTLYYPDAALPRPVKGMGI